ncbi:TolC family outer membrane protein [Endozoicomonas ascidiicola]|uniref:TolC family outer membrane protein n=1 Tax=Endozoicomonas ascidiicola TaxID=1698521 RepID=UPI000833059F|nr:TolC family outer membrane protein [Endozoicomonas ascidiicola]
MNRFPFLAYSLALGLILWNSPASAEALEEALTKALLSHPQVKVAVNRLRAEEKTIGAARADFFPSLDISAGYGTQKKDVPDGTNEQIDEIRFTKQEAAISIKQSLFAGFNTKNRVAGAKKSTEAEQWRLVSTLEEISLKITSVYLRVMERRELVELAKDNLDIHNEIYAQIEQRAKQGVARNSDLIQVEGRLARANANLINAYNNLSDAESEYRSLVGHSPAELAFPSFEHLEIPGDIDAIIQQSGQGNPSLKAADSDIGSFEHAFESRKSAYLPSLNIELDKSWKKDADGQPGSNVDTQVMLRFRYNLFSGGGDKARLMESAYQVEERHSQKDRVMRDLEERVRIAWAAYKFAGEQRVYLLAHEKASRETVIAYKGQFNIGKRTLLDLLDSENELFQSSNSLISAIYQETQARYRILASMGSLLDSMGFVLPESWQVGGE